MNIELTALEQQVMSRLLEGDDPVLHLLREQFRASEISSREMTGVGFFLNFDVPEHISRVGDDVTKTSFELGDIDIEIDGVKNGVGFILFVREGVISWLEGFTYDDPWPDEVCKFTLPYADEKRDLVALRREWSK